MGKSRGRIHKNVLKSWERKHALVIGDLAWQIWHMSGVNKKDASSFLGERKQAANVLKGKSRRISPQK